MVLNVTLSALTVNALTLRFSVTLKPNAPVINSIKTAWKPVLIPFSPHYHPECKLFNPSKSLSLISLTKPSRSYQSIRNRSKMKCNSNTNKFASMKIKNILLGLFNLGNSKPFVAKICHLFTWKLILPSKSIKLYAKQKETWKRLGTFFKNKLLPLKLTSNSNLTDALLYKSLSFLSPRSSQHLNKPTTSKCF